MTDLSNGTSRFMKTDTHSLTLKEKKENTLIFWGTKENPLPDKLFNLWADICTKYSFVINTIVLQNTEENKFLGKLPFEYSPEEKKYVFHLGEKISPIDVEATPENMGIMMSWYHDYEINEDLFWLHVILPGVDEDMYDYTVLNQIIIYQSSRLVRTYNKFRKLKERNPDKWKRPQVKKEEVVFPVEQEKECSECIFHERCDGVFCPYREEDRKRINKRSIFGIFE